MKWLSALIFLKAYRGRRHFGFSRRYPVASDCRLPKVRVRIQVDGKEITQ